MSEASPFHQGEQAIQSRVGVRDRMEIFGRKVIRDYMPMQHQDFYQQLAYVFCAFQAKNGEVWGSLLTGHSGFIQTPDERTLTIDRGIFSGDLLAENIRKDMAIGLLGIDLSNRRRNRLSAHVNKYGNNSLQLAVRQSFGNCPQYIQARSIPAPQNGESSPPAPILGTELTPYAESIISKADTFFVASINQDPTLSSQASSGADMSHRGGKAGFVFVEDEKHLLIPDFPGNFHFNTFGNFLTEPRSGLLFVDFESGDILQLSGHSEVLWQHPLLAHFDNAERFWRFSIKKIRLLRNRIPAPIETGDVSINNKISGDWETATRRTELAERRQQWQPFTIQKIVDESPSVRSFYLEGNNYAFIPGQHINIRSNETSPAIRSYSLSGSKSASGYRISVKRDGEFSNLLHDHKVPGDTLYAQAPNGKFTFDNQGTSPALFIAAGIGITPVIAMLHDLVQGLIQYRQARPALLIAIAQNRASAAFYEEIEALASLSQGHVKVQWYFTQEPEQVNEALTSSDSTAHLSSTRFHRPGLSDYKHAIQQISHTPGELHAYLCGPNAFMQESYDLLRQIDIEDENIFAEAFGPASLERDESAQTSSSNDFTPAESALVQVHNPKGDLIIEQSWQAKDGPLLDWLETHGHDAPNSCRSGRCGACVCKLDSGEVSYKQVPEFEHAANQVLLCSAYPSLSSQSEKTIKITLT